MAVVVALVSVVAVISDLFLRISIWGGGGDEEEGSNNQLFLIRRAGDLPPLVVASSRWPFHASVNTWPIHPARSLRAIQRPRPRQKKLAAQNAHSTPTPPDLPHISNFRPLAGLFNTIRPPPTASRREMENHQ
jgi:hypothetical protein